MAAAVTAGAEAIAARVAASGAGRAVRLAAAAAGALIAFAFFGSFALRERTFHQRLDPPTVAPFRALTDAEGLIGSAPVLVSVDNDVANAWAVYFLRRHTIRLLEYRGYMAQPHLKPLMDRAAPVDIASASYVLSDDGERAAATWCGKAAASSCGAFPRRVRPSGGRRQSQRHGAPQRPVVLLDRSGRDVVDASPQPTAPRRCRRHSYTGPVSRTGLCGASGFDSVRRTTGIRSRATAPNR